MQYTESRLLIAKAGKKEKKRVTRVMDWEFLLEG